MTEYQNLDGKPSIEEHAGEESKQTDKKLSKLKIYPGNPLECGVTRIAKEYNLTIEAQEDARVSLLLYHKRNGKEPVMEIPLTEEFRTGRIFSVRLSGFSPQLYEYNYRINGRIQTDPCAAVLNGREHFGIVPEKGEHAIRCGFFSQGEYDWEGDRSPQYSFSDMVLYKVHVRGYTKQRKLPVKLRGTFAGLREMIPYWQELGINAVELMPAYEFEEIAGREEPSGMIREKRKEGRINYWGYQMGHYFAPKKSYCATKEPEREFCDLIKAMHKAGIACFMEMFFPAEVNPQHALRALQFWKMHYHVDGFHVLGEGAPLSMILKDGILAGTRIFAPSIEECGSSFGKTTEKKRFAEYGTGFQQDMRRFLKSDEGMVPSVQYHLRNNHDTYAVINYITCQDGFTLNDLVSYNYKHNEANGENNTDGSCYNYSWNCGVEGPSRKQSVRQMREHQMRNAFALLMLSQGVPMIYGGDEIANSQGGNNNAYCQDNATGWIDWKGLKKNQSLFSFVKKMIDFRKKHPILHMEWELQQSDYCAKGFPDLSFHGERAWYCNSENTSRLLCMLLNGGYARCADGTEDDSLYLIFNFHWESRKAALPNLSADMRWKKVMDTGDLSGDGFFEVPLEENKKEIEISPRTVVVLQSTKRTEPESKNQ